MSRMYSSHRSSSDWKSLFLALRLPIRPAICETVYENTNMPANCTRRAAEPRSDTTSRAAVQDLKIAGGGAGWSADGTAAWPLIDGERQEGALDLEAAAAIAQRLGLAVPNLIAEA